MVFFYEMLFTAMAVLATIIGEVWSRTFAVVFLLAWFGFVALGYASFGARLARPEGLSDEDVRWYRDARDGLRHLRLLFGLAVLVMLVWRLIAG